MLKGGESNEPRVLRADAQDAGQLFKVVGFYPNAFGGEMNLEVQLDGKGPADRTGTLWTRDFYVLGDPIISGVLQSADGSSSKGQSGKQSQTVVREKFDFDIMRVPFSIGHGQFVMNDAYIKGPLVGASMRGKVDFRAQRIEVGGTYVPLLGSQQRAGSHSPDRAAADRPAGRGHLRHHLRHPGQALQPGHRGQSVRAGDPRVLRELMQLTPEDPRVLPREKSPARNDPAAALLQRVAQDLRRRFRRGGRDARHRCRLVGRGERLAHQEEVIFFTMSEC